MPVERDELLTIEEAKGRLAKLEASYRANANVLRAYIRVLETQEDPQERSNRIEEEAASDG